MVDAVETNVRSGRVARKWLRLRFGLRTLLIAFTAVSVAFGLFGRELVRIRRQRALVEQLAVAGASVAYEVRVNESSAGLIAPTASKFIRWLFGDDLFTDISHVGWEYTYQPVVGSDIELLRRLPAVSRVSIYGSNSASGRHVQPAGLPDSDKAVRREIDEQAASFGLIADCKNVTELMLCGGFTTDAHLRALRNGGNLRLLRLEGLPNVSDDGVIAIAGFKHLAALEIRNAPKVSDEGVAALARLDGLEFLDLSGTPITDVALAHLGQLTRLERLKLHESPITDRGLALLKNLTRLKILRISRAKITDVGMQTIAALSQLQELDLSGAPITDAGLDHLLGLSHLIDLNLMDTQVTDEGLAKLKGITTLRHVVITLGDRLTLDGVRRLKQSLPGCLMECMQNDTKSGASRLQAWE